MVTLRRARWRDAWRLYRWRTDPQTVAMMAGPPPRTFAQHLRWLRATFAHPRRYLFVALNWPVPIGTGRLDVSADGGAAAISVTVAPGYRGRGFAAPVISAILTQCRLLGIVEVEARIKVQNEASRRAFARAGFRLIGQRDGTWRMLYTCR